ncbi:hypothetical protein BY996DRAFT_2530902 [Phakopsora pachyrhizi]|nr:hypothetical protein BY996DRAFT_2530902 [Phakopsora pachyrhizi]
MLEGSFRPPSLTAANSYSQSKSSGGDQHSRVSHIRRKEPSGTGPSFTPAHDNQSPNSTNGLSSAASSQLHPAQHGYRLNSFTEPSRPLPNFNVDAKPALEAVPKDPSFGPVRAKKKPAGSACNSCHRLKTRCSGGYPCDRCAAHKVPCQFDRDLIYRSPLASSSQQASARNAQVMSSAGQHGPAPKSRGRGGNTGPKQAAKRAAAAAAAAAAAQSAPTTTANALAAGSAPEVVQCHNSPSSLALTRPSLLPQPAAPSHPSSRKAGAKNTSVPVPAPSEAFVGQEPHSSGQHGLQVRLAALENSVSGLLQVLRSQQPSSTATLQLPSFECYSVSHPPPIHLNLAMSGSHSSLGPECDRDGDPNRMGCPGNSGIGDPLSEGLLSINQVQYLYDVFVECCLPNLPVLHRVHLSAIRSRSPFLFSTMLAIGARYCSTQSLAQAPRSSSNKSDGSVPASGDVSNAIDEQSYARLVALAYRHLSGTLLKSSHSVDDVRAILFLACWALVANEDPVGPPNRWVLIGHASRIARAISLDRCAVDPSAAHGSWNNPEFQEAKREQLDIAKTDQLCRSIETILSSNLRIESSRDYLPGFAADDGRGGKTSLISMASGSPFQYDVVSSAQVGAIAELAQIWAEVSTLLSAADERNRSLSCEQLLELGECHNQALDSWSKKWTWHGATLRTVRLLSESLRITLNLGLTNLLYSMLSIGGYASSTKLNEALSVSLERANGSSTAVIQAHKDSAREGFSLTFAPDVVTDGLVSAAITVLQLASPFGLATPSNRSLGKESGRRGTNNNDRADVEMSDVTTTTSNNPRDSGFGSRPNQPTSTANSSPSATPRRLSTSYPPQERSSLVITSSATSGQGEMTIKKPLMEPAVAAHYIRMATEVLQASDRSQTRLGTTMANKIIKLATHAGLVHHQPTSAFHSS